MPNVVRVGSCFRVLAPEYYVDGCCRNNGSSNAIAAAAVWERGEGHYTTNVTRAILPSSPTPTSQRAELAAIILGLRRAIHKAQQADVSQVYSTICSDSHYAIRCLTEWIGPWKENDWIISQEEPVLHRDLIDEADRLQREAGSFGVLKYKYVSSEDNPAYKECRFALDLEEAKQRSVLND